MSNYEEKIISLLQKDKIKFEREKRFSDLRGGRYRFDFYVYVECGHSTSCILEIQGQQHYEFIPKFYNTRADFESAKERDRCKISYCLANKIPIYIIPYWELENMSSAADLFDKRFLATNRWKNDLDWQQHKNLTSVQFL